MPTLAPDSAEVRGIDAALQEWRQGDLALDEQWFIHIGDPAEPLTEASAEADGKGLQALTWEVAGLVVVTQTCDIVRPCSERPFVEVCPLIEVDDGKLQDVVRGRRPAYVLVPELVRQRLVADLDRTMTVEKPIVAKWKRTPGYRSDAEARAFAQALSRKRVRFAFPDDFVGLARKLQERLIGKHEKNTDEGRGLRALREIRVQATPSWDAETVALFFWFIRDGESGATDFEGKSWADLLREWLKLVPVSARFTEVDGAVVTLADITGADYVGSDPLDLDHLSSRTSST